MNKTTTIISLFLLSSCSTLVLEPAEPMLEQTGREAVPITKGTGSQPVAVQLDRMEVLHHFQTDHRSILIQHVERRDSVFVQTLTEEDMAALNITEDEQAFSNAYVVQLNELIKHQ